MMVVAVVVVVGTGVVASVVVVDSVVVVTTKNKSYYHLFPNMDNMIYICANAALAFFMCIWFAVVPGSQPGNLHQQ